METVVAVLRAHRMDATVQVRGTQALKGMVAAPGAREKACAVGAMEAVTVSLYAHSSDRQMQECGASLIKSLAARAPPRRPPLRPPAARTHSKVSGCMCGRRCTRWRGRGRR